ncbi:MAG: hypothetical protein LC126_16085 [Bryobacterales bacterium]|nr:hypothetical protein [Bryobacterales bacterium]
MKDKRLARYLMLAAFAAIPLAAQTNPVFSPRRMKDYNEQSRDGRCVLRVRVDDEIDVELRGNSVLLRTITGRPGKDEGSECSQPLPAGGFTKFNFRGIDGRGEVRLVQEPRLGNNWTAIVAIRDKKGGDEGYTFELSWTTDGSAMSSGGSGFGAQPAPGGFGQPNNEFGTPSRTGGGILPSLGGARGSGRAGSFTGTDETFQGTGTFRLGGKDYPISRMRVNLRSGGEAEFTVYSSEVFSLTGRWTGGGDAVDIEINNGFGSAGASARGKVYLTSAGRVDHVELDGSSSRFSDRYTIQYAK